MAIRGLVRPEPRTIPSTRASAQESYPSTKPSYGARKRDPEAKIFFLQFFLRKGL